ncbi:MAG TPA: DUF4404 family protein [Lacipirellulaceae bacterium]|nr:DUF4404 family protein [Lacipirellulaceae bacterium]
MDKQRLLQTIDELRTKVAQTERVDPETLTMLENAMRDVQRELEKHETQHSANIEPASSGLKNALLRFQAEHPKLTDSVGKVADALAEMGF